MKKAYFIIGAESSGTRVLTKAFIKAGCYGDGEHLQRLDSLNFNNLPDNIVFRRSLPHAHHWPCVGKIKKLMEDAGYAVEIIGIERNPLCVIISQLRGFQHARSQEEAEDNIKKADAIRRKYADTFMDYEDLVNDEKFRKEFFESRELQEPIMNFYDANIKYAHLIKETDNV